MHLEADTMSAKFTNDIVSVLFDMLLDCMADIANTVAFLTFFKTEIKSFLGDAKETFFLLGDLAHHEGVARVGDITIEIDDTITGDDITVVKEELVAGYAMDNDIVDGHAKSCGETLVTFAERNTAVITDKLLSEFVKESSRDAGTHMATHFRESACQQVAAGPDELNFFFGL